MRMILLAITLFVTSVVKAEYFFVINDAVTTACMYSEVSGKRNFEKLLESSYKTNCDAQEDVEGTVIFTCKARLTNIVYATKSESKCKSLRSNMNAIIGR